MTYDGVLNGLLVLSIILAALVALIATAALGRKIADLELQRERGVGGVPRIQSLINIRSQIGDVLFGVFFVVLNVMLLAGAPIEWRTWSFRILWTVLLAVVLAHKVLDWIAERQQVRLLMSEQQSTLNSYREMTEEAITNLEMVAAQTQPAQGTTHPAPLAPVVPEHSSPTTMMQRETAHIATMRARLVAANLGLGIDPRPMPPPSTDEAAQTET